MKKKLLFLFVLAIFLFPAIGFAKEDSVLYDKLYKILGEDGKLVISDISTLDANHLDNYNYEEGDTAYDIGFTRVVASYINNLPEVKKLLKDYADENPYVDVFCVSYTNCGITMVYDTDARGDVEPDEYPNGLYKHYDVEIEMKDAVDQTAYTWIKDHFSLVIDNFEVLTQDFYLYDLAFINQLYNQNNGIESILNKWNMSPSLISKNFPEIRDLLNDNPDYDVRYGMWSNMGEGWTTVEYVKSADFVAFYKDTAYLMSTFTFHIAPVLYVDENTADEDLINAAKARIDAYLNDENVNVVIDDITATFTQSELDAIYADLDNFLDLSMHTTHEENTRVYSLKIGATESNFNFFIIRTNSANIKNLEIQAIERKTGIRFLSNSALIPVDSELVVDDVTEQYVALNSSIEKAFDINLFSAIKDGYLTDSFGNITLYIPVADDFDIEGKQVVYLDENGEISEEFDARIETIDGKKYLAFETQHLSVYGIVDDSAVPATIGDGDGDGAGDTDGEIVNPKTVDNVVLYAYTIAFSSICLIGAAVYRKRHTN